MAKLVITAARLGIGGTDYSALARSTELTLESDAPEVTNMDSNAWKEFLAGLKSASFSTELFRDSATSLDSDLWTAYDAGTALAITMQADDAAVSATNPEWQFNILVTTYQPIGAAVGDASMFTWSPQVTGAVTRDTTP